MVLDVRCIAANRREGGLLVCSLSLSPPLRRILHTLPSLTRRGGMAEAPTCQHANMLRVPASKASKDHVTWASTTLSHVTGPSTTLSHIRKGP